MFVYLYTQFNARGKRDEPTEPACVQTNIQVNHPITITFRRTRVFLECIARSNPIPHQLPLEDEPCNPSTRIACLVRIPTILLRLRGFLCFLDGVCNRGLVVEMESDNTTEVSITGTQSLARIHFNPSI